VAAVLAVAGRRIWTTFETAGPDGQTHAYYAGRLRPELAHLIWGPQPGDVDAAAADGIHTGLEPRWDWRRARRAHQEPETAVLGCWCVGTPQALAPLDNQAPNQVLHGARYLAWGKRLAQIVGRPRLQLDGRDVGALEASKGAAAEWLCRHLGLPLAQAAAFGDSDNDLDLLERAGTAVAMANATADARARAVLTQKAEGAIAGLGVAEAVFRRVDPEVRFEARVGEGEWREGGVVAEAIGRARSLLAAERVSLNFLGRLSGVATLTARYVRAVEGTGVRILDTRKTTPGLRVLEKYAVRVGGCRNHRGGQRDARVVARPRAS
jgi:hypothetical protein